MSTYNKSSYVVPHVAEASSDSLLHTTGGIYCACAPKKTPKSACPTDVYIHKGPCRALSWRANNANQPPFRRQSQTNRFKEHSLGAPPQHVLHQPFPISRSLTSADGGADPACCCASVSIGEGSRCSSASPAPPSLAGGFRPLRPRVQRWHTPIGSRQARG